jgi:nifR3 family TIM-barrel protein
VGVQLFGADGKRMGEAAKKIVDWKQPDFIDINFGCPVNKVVSKNGGSSLLRDCPVLAEVASEVAKAVNVPVTAKMRIGWDSNSINALQVVRILEDSGMQAIAIHGRTRAQGYTGEADWEVIGQCAEAARVPIVGNGDIATGVDVERRRQQTKVSGIMIGRAAMMNPWVFREAKHYLEHGTQPALATAEQRIGFMRRHVELAVGSNRYGSELQTMRSMRSRLMNYTKFLPGGKWLRMKFSTVSSVMELEDAVASYFTHRAELAEAEAFSA